MLKLLTKIAISIVITLTVLGVFGYIALNMPFMLAVAVFAGGLVTGMTYNVLSETKLFKWIDKL